ncbi:hypothetical protein AB0C44_00615 [Micromonospora taraxaci]|uniref:hypothetical protein n=1 Tax=Micromonospora TaxID=1873 RepID=UPI001153B013|nr:hypothetical protein [Micromonospora sp. A202]WSK49838.1 hypothetical protein OG423_05500 [Micromonospora zamorensis]
MAPFACPQEFLYDITSSSSTHLPASSTYYKDGPGGNMTVSVQSATTISATASVSAGATISGLVAQAQVEVSASATASKQITVGHQYSRDIASGKYGNMQYGSWGHTVSWTYSRVNPSCSVTRLSSGSGGKIPNNAVGWRYWETSS